LRIYKIVHSNQFRLSLGPPFSPVILEVSNQFSLLSVYRNHGLAAAQTPFNFPAEVLKLRIAVRVVRPFLRLAVGLQAVAQLMQ